MESTAELPALDLEAYEAELEAGGQPALEDAEGDSESTLVQPRLIESGSSDFSALEAEIVALSSDVERLRGLLFEREAGLNVARDLQERERQRALAAEATSLAAQQKLAAAEAEIGVAREERATLWQRNESLDGDLRAAQALIDELNTAASGHTAQLADLNARVTAAEASAAWAQADSQGIRAQVAALQEALRSRESRRGIWETIWREADAELAARSASSGRLTGELEQAMARIAGLERELAESRAETMAARAATSDALLKAEANGSRGDTFEQELARTRTDLSAATARIATLDADLLATRQSVDTQQAELAALRAQLAALQASSEQAAVAASSSEAKLRDALRAAEARVHQLDVELNLKTARLEALKTFESARPASPAAPVAPLPAAPAAPADAVAPAAQPEPEFQGTATVTPLRPAAEAAPVTSQPPRREPELLPDGAPRYLVLSEEGTETVFRLGRRTSIGRADDNEISLARASISRHHAVIISGPRQTLIEDLNSTNGVLVNKKRVREAVLRDGDVVHIGKCRFRFTHKVRATGKS